MKLTLKSVILPLFAMAFFFQAKAAPAKKKIHGEHYFFQKADVSGTVLDNAMRPVAGALVRALRSELTATANEKGFFTFKADTGDTLIISQEGYIDNQYVVGNEKVFTIVLLKDPSYVPGRSLLPVQQIYTTTPRNLAIASNDAIYNKDILKSPVTSVRNALVGRLVGLYTLQSSGQPGADGVSMSLRGQSPLVIIDGVVANLTTFDLEEIESVTVLKDALGTAMLGVRGSNGALVINTRKGTADKMQLSFTAQTAIQKPIGRPKTLGAYDYARLYNEALRNDGLQPLYSDSDLLGYQNHTDPYRYPDVDWQNQVLKNTSRFDRYTFSAIGGNKYARYFVALEHANQEGFFRTVDSNKYNTNNDFKTYVIRSNIDISVTPKLTGGIYLLGRILNANEPGATTGTILNSLLTTPAGAYPVLNEDGSFGGSQQFQNNILAQTINSGYRQNYKRDMLANFYLKRTLDEVTKGLWLQARAAYNATISENITRNKSFAVYQKITAGYQQFGTNGNQANSNGMDYQGRSDYEEFSIGYDRTFSGTHGINALMLVNRDNSVSGSDLPYTITGGSGRLAYNYKGKYVAEGTFGLNGSNRYPDNGATKRGFFPAFGLAWNIEQENFLKRIEVISQLKLFGSYGKTGWDDPGYFSYYQRFFDASTTYFGTGASGNTSISEQRIANRNISWEKANKLNVGLHGTLLKDKLGFSVEYYNNKFYDLLMQRGRNSTLLGNDYPDENIGQYRYTGLEGQLSWQQSLSNFSYFIAANANIQNSEVLNIDEVYRQYDWMMRTGKMVGQRFGYIADGLFQTQAEINSSATTVGYTPQPGDIKYKDLNNDKVIDQFDIAPIGDQKPLFFFGTTLGIQWKGLDFSALVQGVRNREIYVGGASLWPFQASGFGQAYQDNLNRWTPTTSATATYPRLNIGNNSNNHATSSYWLVSGNYVRLKQLEIGYSMPATLIKKSGLQSARIFASGYNLLTASSDRLGGRDPEVNSAFNYPLQRLFNFGINIKL